MKKWLAVSLFLVGAQQLQAQVQIIVDPRVDERVAAKSSRLWQW